MQPERHVVHVDHVVVDRSVAGGRAEHRAIVERHLRGLIETHGLAGLESRGETIEGIES